jgi:hypothetical protein
VFCVAQKAGVLFFKYTAKNLFFYLISLLVMFFLSELFGQKKGWMYKTNQPK